MVFALLSAIWVKDAHLQSWVPLELRYESLFKPSAKNVTTTRGGGSSFSEFRRLWDYSTITISMHSSRLSRPVSFEGFKFHPRNEAVTPATRTKDLLPLGSVCEILSRPPHFDLTALTACEEARINLFSTNVSNEKFSRLRKDYLAKEEAFMVRLARESLSRFAGQQRATVAQAITVNGRKLASLLAAKSEVTYVGLVDYLGPNASSIKNDPVRATIEFNVGDTNFLFVLGSSKYVKNNVWYEAGDIPFIYDEKVWLPLAVLPK